VGQHAVHSIEVLTDVLQEKESTAERWEERGTEQTLQETQIPTQKNALCFSAGEGHDPIGLRHEDVGIEGRPA
jgi:hypothetical protein